MSPRSSSTACKTRFFTATTVAGRMEYLKMHGSFDEIPLEQMLAAYREMYPHWNLQTLQ